MNKTTVKITKRASGYSALISYAWGEKVRILGLLTKEDAEKRASDQLNRRKQYTMDKDLNISSAAAALGSIRTPKKTASSRESGEKGGRPKTIINKACEQYKTEMAVMGLGKKDVHVEIMQDGKPRLFENGPGGRQMGIIKE